MVLEQIVLLNNLRLPCKLACPSWTRLYVLVHVQADMHTRGMGVHGACTTATAIVAIYGHGMRCRLTVAEKSCREYQMVWGAMCPCSATLVCPAQSVPSSRRAREPCSPSAGLLHWCFCGLLILFYLCTVCLLGVTSASSAQTLDVRWKTFYIKKKIQKTFHSSHRIIFLSKEVIGHQHYRKCT